MTKIEEWYYRIQLSLRLESLLHAQIIKIFLPPFFLVDGHFNKDENKYMMQNVCEIAT